MKRIFNDALREYCARDYYPWHMPGHKRQNQLLTHTFGVEYDVTELPGLDNLLVPEGVIGESRNQLPEIYRSYASYYLVNGSTSGLLTAISAICKPGDTIIMARHCHKAVYHAVALLELTPVYLYPTVIMPYNISGSISPEQIEEALQSHENAKAVILPSPTYEGVLSDIDGIQKLVHQAGAYLIVDEAHGAHLEFGLDVPASAVRCGADCVIQSLHKTLPCYNSCALLHLCRKDKSLQERIERYLGVYQTSSPSYQLVANMEDCIATVDSWRNSKMVEYYSCLRQYRAKWERLKQIHLLTIEEVQEQGSFAYDESKLVFCLPNGLITGVEFATLMEEQYGMIVEMASRNYVIAMTSVADSEAAFQRLDQALQKLDKELLQMPSKTAASGEEVEIPKELAGTGNELVYLPGPAWQRPNHLVLLEEAENLIAGDFVTVYPPGIPVLVPGERISKKIIQYIKICIESNLTVQGITVRKEKENQLVFLSVL